MSSSTTSFSGSGAPMIAPAFQHRETAARILSISLAARRSPAPIASRAGRLQDQQLRIGADAVSGPCAILVDQRRQGVEIEIFVPRLRRFRRRLRLHLGCTSAPGRLHFGLGLGHAARARLPLSASALVSPPWPWQFWRLLRSSVLVSALLHGGHARLFGEFGFGDHFDRNDRRFDNLRAQDFGQRNERQPDRAEVNKNGPGKRRNACFFQRRGRSTRPASLQFPIGDEADAAKSRPH